jgi:hypothetical protein
MFADIGDDVADIEENLRHLVPAVLNPDPCGKVLRQAAVKVYCGLPRARKCSVPIKI